MHGIRKVIDDFPDGVVSLDRHLRLSYANRSFAALVGQAAQQLLGRHLTALGFPADTAKQLESAARAVRETATNGECEIVVPAGAAERRYHVRLTPSRTGRDSDAAVIGVLRDVTDLLRERTAALAEANRQLAAAKEEIESFSRIVIHDVGNQAVVVGMLARRLKRLHNSGNFLDETAPIETIRAQALRIEELMRDLGKLLRAGKVELAPASVDLSAVAREIAAGLPKREQGLDVAWGIPAGITARGDPRLLRILLENLIGNAWKFTRGTACPSIEFGRAADGAYFVRDNGCGFDQSAAGKIFEPFRRLHDDEEIEGTGMGLAIVERIVSRHGGRVWAEGASGSGACFFFTLPD